MLPSTGAPKQPKRVAYMFYDRPNYCAGPTINARRLLPELVRRGYEVTALVGYLFECPSREFLEGQGVAVRAVEWPEWVEDQVLWIQKQLGAVDPDIFVPNVSVSGCYAGRYLREAGRPTIAGHLSTDEFNWGMAERFVRSQDEWALSGLFCMGDVLSDTVRGWQPARTIVKNISHGAPLPETQVDPSGPLRLVYAGRVVQPQKRIHELVDAMIEAAGRHPQLTAKIIGDGSERAAIQRRVAASGFADRFHFTGFVDPGTVQNEMLDGNVFILLSDFEALPGAVKDAMACGLVPVCLDIPGVRELVIHEETGLLVSDRGEDFQKALDRLAGDDDLRRRLSTNARQHIVKGFTHDAAADRWEELFAEVWASAGPRVPIRFPRNLTWLPAPYPALLREDRRRPPLSQRAIRRSSRAIRDGVALPGRALRWAKRHL
jgi:colanic acid/amylovoran biosynthesis glycosyltransferase